MLLVDRLQQLLPTAKRVTLKRMVQDGRVTINGRAAYKLGQTLGDGDEVRVADQAAGRPGGRAARRAAELPFPIVYEDEDLLVIDKPSGLLTSTVPREKRATALEAVRQYVARTSPRSRVGLVHRLDREASGLLVFSKTDAAYQSLKSQFFQHSVERIYLAIVSPSPQPAAGMIESNLVEWADGTVHKTKMKNRGQAARTEYVTVRQQADMALLRVKLHTGRKHQIRAHLSQRGCPVVGDDVYGGKAHPFGLMLAAVELHLDHPRSGRRMKFQIELPRRMGEAILSGASARE